MRLNAKKYKEVMNQQGVTISELSYKTGLSPKSIEWIMKNGFASEDAMERLAEVVALDVKEIYLPEISSLTENTIEFEKDNDRATVTFSQGRYKTRIMKLAKARPSECEIVAVNKDGSIYAHIPVAWIRINPTKEFSNEERERLAEHARNVFHNRSNRAEKG